MHDHPATHHPDLLVGIDTSDDAGVYRIAPDRGLVQTVDFFTPVVDHPRDWGRIAAANALSDVYAMGGNPLTALQMIGWPREKLDFALAAEVIEGGAEVMAEAGCTIVGGHSIDDLEPKYGFAVTGEVRLPGGLVTNAGGRPGDGLVLTKPIGTGIIATAIKRAVCPPEVAAEAVRWMTTLNRAASVAMVSAGVSAATDVTGFGLLGHLAEINRASGTGARLDAGAVPVIDGAWDLLEAGMFPGGSIRNLKAVAGFVSGDTDDPVTRMLADAQTSGGLLIAVAEGAVTRLLEALEDRGVDGWLIGELTEGSGIEW